MSNKITNLIPKAGKSVHRSRKRKVHKTTRRNDKKLMLSLIYGLAEDITFYNRLRQ